jgi:hypothetical protein
MASRGEGREREGMNEPVIHHAETAVAEETA